jgi:hypothetical protein
LSINKNVLKAIKILYRIWQIFDSLRLIYHLIEPMLG